MSLLILWAAWWGGLTFYALAVVPIGTEVIGSVSQGFITQRVTQWHNGLTGVITLALFFEAYRRRNRSLNVVASSLLLVTIALIAWHARLTGMMNFRDETVPSGFYAEHAVYLWITAAEWGLGIAIPAWLLPIVNEERPNEAGADQAGA